MADLFARPCKTCGKPIRFFSTPQGSSMPVEAEPEKRVIADQNNIGRVVDTYVPHWGNCAQADQHRRSK